MKMFGKLTSEALTNLIPTNDSETTRSHGNDEYPKLDLKIFIVGKCFLSGVIEMFAKAGCKAATTVEEADLLVFTGGEDIDPALYGEQCLRNTHFNAARDEREIDIFTKAVSLGKPMFGICRGMQLLHALNGSKLYQDVGNHTYTHNIIDMDGNTIRASSMHHQMCIEDDTVFPIAYAAVKGYGEYYVTHSKEVHDPNHNDLEGAIYPNINAIAVQGHPEVGGYPEYTIWCLNRIAEYLDEKFVMGSNSKQMKDVEFIKQSAKVKE